MQSEFEYRMHPILIDLGDQEPPVDIMATPEPIELELLAPKPFLLRASGLQWLNPIRQQIASMGLRIEDELHLNNFEELAKRLYPVSADTPNSYLWLMLSREFLGERSNTAHAFSLNSQHLVGYEAITNAKKSCTRICWID